MAPSFLLRKSHSKADLTACGDQEGLCGMPGRKRNKWVLDMQATPSALAAHTSEDDSALLNDTSNAPVITSPTNRRFLSAVQAFIRHPRTSASRESLVTPKRRPRAVSVPSNPVDVLNLEPVEAPAELPSWLFASDSRISLSATIDAQDLGQDSLLSDWASYTETLIDRSSSHRSNRSLRLEQPEPSVETTSPPEESRLAIVHGPSTMRSMTDIHTSTGTVPLTLGTVLIRDTQAQVAGSEPTELEKRDSANPVEHELTLLKEEHAAQVEALNEEHGRQIASLRTHISLLEKQATLPAGQHLSPSGLLPRLDTSSRPHSRQQSETHSRSPSCDSAFRTSAESVRALKSALEQHQRMLEQAFVDMDTLRNSLEEHKAIVIDRTQKLDLAEGALNAQSQTVAQMKKVLLNGAKNEITLKTRLAALQTQLDTTNSELRGSHCEVEALNERLAASNIRYVDLENDLYQSKHHEKTLTEQNASLKMQLDIVKEDSQSKLMAANNKATELERFLDQTQIRLTVERDRTKQAESDLCVAELELATLQTKVIQLEQDLRTREQTGLITIVNALDRAHTSPAKSSKSSPSNEKSLSALRRAHTSPADELDLSPSNDRDQLQRLKDKVRSLQKKLDAFATLYARENRRFKRSSTRREPSGNQTVPWAGDARASLYDAFLEEQRELHEVDVAELIVHIDFYQRSIRGYKKDIRELQGGTPLGSPKSGVTSINSDQPEHHRFKSPKSASRAPVERPVKMRGRRSVSVDSPSADVLKLQPQRPTLRHYLSLDITQATEQQARMRAASTQQVEHNRSEDAMLRPLSMVAEAGSAVEERH